MGQSDIKDQNSLVQAFMARPEGRAFMMRHIMIRGTHAGAFNPDPHVNAYNSGLQAAGKSLDADLQAICPDEYVIMIKEELENQDDGRREPSDD